MREKLRLSLTKIEGSIIQVNLKPRAPGERGLPKTAVDSAFLSIKGLEGDYNVRRIEKKGGNLNRAVLILTLDRIKELRERGWPVQLGHLGENFSVSGLVYDAFDVGQEYAIGRNARIRISEPCNPCENLSVLPYVGKERVGEFMKTLLGRRGWYASVIEEDRVKEGDLIRRVF